MVEMTWDASEAGAMGWYEGKGMGHAVLLDVRPKTHA